MNLLRRVYVDLIYYIFKIIYPFPKVHTIEETLELLINTNKSIARFGDGEFHMLGMTESLGFQSINSELSKRLKNILQDRNPNCLIAVPYGLQSVKEFNDVGKYFWKQFVVFHYRKYLKYFDYNMIYCNTNVTRPYIDYKNSSTTLSYFNRMKQLWEDKKLLIIEGEMSRLGIGNDLFSSAKSIHRLIILSQNAFSLYDKILNASMAIAVDYDLILISLGPTATLLSYDLSKSGKQVIDIGHIDLEYEWFIRGVKEKVKIERKHVNELSYMVESNECHDPNYNSQIIKKIVS